MERIICFGDSITAGRNTADGHRWTSLLQNALDTVAPSRFEVLNRGIGGQTTYDGLLRIDADVLTPLEGGWVLIEFGLNDASVPPKRSINRCPITVFTPYLEEIIRMVRKEKGKPVLLTNHPIRQRTVKEAPQGNRRPYHTNFKPYQPAIRELAAQTRTPLIDLEKALANVPLEELLVEDGIHLNTSGNRHYARAVIEGLRPLLKLK